MIKYSYRINGLNKAPAQVAGEVCEALTKTEAGLTPQTLLDASRDESAPLHDEFEWNDEIAAEGYRRQQAQSIIQNIVIVSSTEEQQETVVRSFVSIPKHTERNAYVPINVVLGNESMKEGLLDYAKREMKSFIAKYSQLKQLAGVIEEMRKVC